MEAGVDANTARPLITAVIPTFQRSRLLRRAIASVLEQENASLQVCVYDNASDDDTAATVASLARNDPRLHYYRHSTNIGSIANFDFGLRQVNTPFFSILSDDDYLLPGFYRKALAGLSSHPAAMFWAGLTLNVDESGLVWDARVLRWPREGLFEPPEGFMMLTGGMAPVWNGILFRREVFDRAGFPDPGMGGPSDLEYCLRLAARFPYLVEKYPSAVFTLNGRSFSATQPLSAFWPGWRRLICKFASDDSLHPGFRAGAGAALRRDARRMLFRRGANAIASRRFDFATEAAEALKIECGGIWRGRALRAIAGICSHSPIVQRAFASLYRTAERRIVRSRSSLQAQYASLLRTA